MTDLSHIEGLKQGEQMYVVEVQRHSWGGVTRKSIPLPKNLALMIVQDCQDLSKLGFSAAMTIAPTGYLCPECERPLDKVWKDAKQTEVSHLSCRNDDCRWSSKDRLQHPRKREHSGRHETYGT